MKAESIENPCNENKDKKQDRGRKGSYISCTTLSVPATLLIKIWEGRLNDDACLTPLAARSSGDRLARIHATGQESMNRKTRISIAQNVLTLVFVCSTSSCCCLWFRIDSGGELGVARCCITAVAPHFSFHVAQRLRENECQIRACLVIYYLQTLRGEKTANE